MEYVKTTMIDTVLSLIAPHRCSSCGEVGAVLCESCKHDIISDSFSGCVLCTRPCGEGGLCGQCARGTNIIQAWCVAERRGGLKTLLDSYKFESKRGASGVCAELLHETLPILPESVAVVSIPSAVATVRARGFDHMGKIADEFARRRGLTRAWPLERISSETLHFLSAKERSRLGPTLFSLSGRAVPRHVLLLDDIVTTGTTLRAAVRLIHDAGAERIYVAAVARQPFD